MSYSFTLVPMLLLVTISCLVTSVLSSPSGAVSPAIPLNQMDPEHACLFLCSMCFTSEEDTEKLLTCSNQVCGSMSHGTCAMEKFLWLGHHCRHYGLVETMWSR